MTDQTDQPPAQAPQVTEPAAQATYIDPAKVAIYLMAYRCQPNRFLQDWLDALRLRAPAYLIRYGSEEYGIPEAREQNCNRFLAEDVPAGREYLVQIDADIVPLQHSDGILRDNGELVYVGYCGHDASQGHYGDSFGAGFCRIHKSVLQRIAKPWWKMMFQNDRRALCECGFFRIKAEAVGVKPRMVGIAGHEATVITIPKSSTDVAIFNNRQVVEMLKAKT